eukprot:204469_1
MPAFELTFFIFLYAYFGSVHGQQHQKHGPGTAGNGTSGSESSNSNNGDTAVMGFLVITLCCLLGCCINACLRTSRRRRRRQLRRIRSRNSALNAIQLFRLNQPSHHAVQYELDDLSIEESVEGKNTFDTGILINLDQQIKSDTNPNANNMNDVDEDINVNDEEDDDGINAHNRIDIEAIKRDKSICVICRDELSGNVRLLDCNHIFCQLCIKKWEKEGNCLCPICRQPTCST